MSTTEAFGKFKGKHLDSSNVDFSDKIRRSNKKQGYVSWTRGEYELAGEGEAETVEQKFQRLNVEVKHLLDELDELKEKSDKSKDEKASLVSLAKQTTMLQDQLATMKLEEVLGSEPVQDLQDPRGAAKAKLLSQLEQLKTERKPAPDAAKESKGSKDDVLYELMMKPSTSAMEDQKRLAVFESRLEALEKVLGSGDKMSVLSVETNTKNVTAAVSVLNARLALLDPGHLDHVEGRLAALIQKMNTVAEKKAAAEDAEKSNKIAELYEMVTANQGVASALPEIVDRLDSLQSLHNHALQFSKTLTQLDTVQEKLELSLAGNQKLLEETQKKFTDNLDTVKKNFDSIDQRLNKLQK